MVGRVGGGGSEGEEEENVNSMLVNERWKGRKEGGAMGTLTINNRFPKPWTRQV